MDKIRLGITVEEMKLKELKKNIIDYSKKYKSINHFIDKLLDIDFKKIVNFIETEQIKKGE
jgi:hypothetical protein